MRLSQAFLTHDDGQQKLLVSTGASAFAGLVRCNETAGFIVSCLEKECTEDEIVAGMLEKWEVSEEAARKGVRSVVSRLREIGAIEDEAADL